MSLRRGVFCVAMAKEFADWSFIEHKLNVILIKNQRSTTPFIENKQILKIIDAIIGIGSTRMGTTTSNLYDLAPELSTEKFVS